MKKEKKTKKKLSLNKLQVTKINNPKVIKGGDGDFIDFIDFIDYECCEGKTIKIKTKPPTRTI